MNPAYLRFLATFASAGPVPNTPAASQSPAPIQVIEESRPAPEATNNNAAAPFPIRSDPVPVYANVA